MSGCYIRRIDPALHRVSTIDLDTVDTAARNSEQRIMLPLLPCHQSPQNVGRRSFRTRNGRHDGHQLHHRYWQGVQISGGRAPWEKLSIPSTSIEFEYYTKQLRLPLGTFYGPLTCIYSILFVGPLFNNPHGVKNQLQHWSMNCILINMPLRETDLGFETELSSEGAGNAAQHSGSTKQAASVNFPHSLLAQDWKIRSDF